MRYKLLGKSGLRVSELALGTMTFGTEWGWGADYETSKAIFDYYAETGGNFIDTANRYTEGTSEKMLADFIAHDRDHFVLASKYTLYDKLGDLNYAGNHRKNMYRSVHESLKRLKTDYIDLFWVHMWDFTTPVEEVLRGLDDLIKMGKIHYIGISDTPAWVVAKANMMAELKNWTSFVALQVEYSLIQRTPERDLIPMAKDFGMTLTPWAALGGGVLTGKYLSQSDTGRVVESSARRNDRNTEIARKAVEIAQKYGFSPAQTSIRWAMQQNFSSIPIVGARKMEQIKDCLGASDIILPQEAIDELNQISAIDLGFPHEFLNQPYVQNLVFSEMRDKIDWVKK